MKRFLIHVSTHWCGEEDTFRAVAESESDLWDLAEQLAYDNFYSYGHDQDIAEEEGYDPDEMEEGDWDELWRQQDATRNSIQSVGQAYFSHKQLEGLNTNQIQELLFQEKGINWNDYPTKFRRGSCCIKKYHQTMNQTLRGYWYIDDEIPIFTGEGRDYIEKLI